VEFWTLQMVHIINIVRICHSSKIQIIIKVKDFQNRIVLYNLEERNEYIDNKN
jgi:hypothetical protein